MVRHESCFRVFLAGGFFLGSWWIAAQEVGIGTTTPSVRLDIQAPSSYPHALFRVMRGTGTYLFVSNGGNVGIRTQAPVNVLDVRHGQVGGITVGRTISQAGEGLYLTGSGFMDDKDWGAVTAGVWHDIGTYTARSDAASGLILANGDVSLKAVEGLTPGTFGISFPTRLFVDGGTGNVGVGTTSPDHRLEVNGSVELQVDNADSKIRFHDPGNAWFSMGIDISDGRKFKINYGGNIGDNAHFTITSSGRVGIGTGGPIARLHVANDGMIYAEGNYGSGTDIPTGAKTAMIWNPKKAAFRAGRAYGTEWDPDSVGPYSVAMGYNTKAKSNYSTISGGLSNTVSGWAGTISGGGANIASGYASTIAGGYSNATSGDYSAVLGGISNGAGGPYSTVSGGGYNAASGFASTVGGGYFNTTSGDYSWAGGRGMKLGASADRTFVWGYNSSIAPPTITAVDAFLIGPNGNTYRVGINTGSPSTVLDIYGNGTGSNMARIRVRSTDNQAGISFLSDNTGEVLLYSPDNTNDLAVWVGGARRMTIKDNGRVGIGTATPGARLHVAGGETEARIVLEGTPYTEIATDSWGNSFGILWNAYRANPGVNGHLFVTGNTKYKNPPGPYSQGAAAIGGFLNQSYGGEIWILAAPGGTPGTNVTWTQLAYFSRNRVWLSPRGVNSDFYITSQYGGRVGIGTANPVVKLDVRTGSSVRALDIHSGAYGSWTGLAVYRSSPVDGGELGIAAGTSQFSTFATAGDVVLRANQGANDVIITAFGSGSAIRFGTGTGSTDIERMTIANNGYVGIGVNAPGYRLQLPNTGSVAGRGLANQWVTYSDGRLKSRLRSIKDPLAIVERLRPLYFFHHNSHWDSAGKLVVEEKGTYRYGFVAQELVEVVPEAVTTPEDPEQLWGVNYGELVPILTAALQEQSRIIARQDRAIKRQKEEIARLRLLAVTMETRLSRVERLLSLSERDDRE